MNNRFNLRFLLIIFWVLALLAPPCALVVSNSYFFNIHALGNLLASYFVGALGIIVVDKNIIERERYYLLLFNLSIFLWLWAEGFGHLCRPTEARLAISWYKTANIGIVFLPAHVYAFTISFLKLQKPKLMISAYVIGGIFAFLGVFMNFFITGVHWFSWGFYPQWDFYRTMPYFWYFSGFLGLSLFEYFRAYKKTTNLRTRNQIKYLFLGFGMSYFGSIDYLPTFGHDVYPCGYIAILAWWSTLAYAILKHRLMDITVIIRKTLIYSSVMGTLMLIYLAIVSLFTHIFAGLTGYQTVFSSSVAAGLITLCFQPLRKRIQTFVDTKFFRQYVDREEKLYELSREVITHTTPEAMGDALMHVISEALHPKAGALFLRSRAGSGFVRVSGTGISNLPELMGEDNELARYFKDHPQPFVQDVATDLGQSHSTRLKTEREDAA